MTIADEKIKSSSERFMLFKLTPKRSVGNDLQLISSPGLALYEMDFDYPVEHVTSNLESNMTQAGQLPLVQVYEWFYDKENKKLHVSLDFGEDASANIIIAYFNVYLTGEKTRYFHDDPVALSGGIVEWQPKISRFPTIMESIKNIISGVFSISSLSFDVIDTDKSLRSLLDVNTTFFNSEIKVWSFINSERFLSYVGKVTKIKPTTNSLNFTVLDQFSTLSSVASMGDSDDRIYAKKTFFPSLENESIDKPIPYFFGVTSHSKMKKTTYENQGANGLGVGFLPEMNSIFEGNEAIKNNAKKYILGRTGSSGIANQNVGTITNVSGLAGGLLGYETFMFFESTGHNMKINDTFKVDSADSSKTYFCCVSELSGSLFSQIDGFTCKVFSIDPQGRAADWSLVEGGLNFDDFINHPVTAASTFYLGKSVQVRVKYNDGISRPVGMNRTAGFVTETTLPSGNKLIELDLNAQNNPDGSNEFDTEPEAVYFTMTSSDDASHENVVQKILQSSGLNVDVTSITQAGIDLDVECLFQIPFAGSDVFPTYLKVLEKVCESTLSMVYVNNDLEASYEVIKAPAANTQQIGDDLSNAGRLQVEYQDIATTIIGRNKHYNTISSSQESTGPNVILSDEESKFLNGIEKTKVIEHVLRDVGTRFQEILNLISKRRITYSFDVATELADARINDNITLTGSILVGNELTRNAKVVSLKKSPSKITTQVIDLEGL